MKLSDFARVAALSLLPACILSAQNLDAVFKAQASFQNSASAPGNLPYSWIVSFQSPTANKVTPPGGAAVSLVYNSSNQQAKLAAGFATKAAMDAAFPNGTYVFAGPPAINLAETGDIYSAATPQVTGGGTWSNGVLVVDPTVSNTLTFSNFTDYASTGGGQVGGHMDFSLNSTTNADNVDINQQVLTQSFFGLQASATPFTSYTIPAGTLTAGNVYQGEIDFDRLCALDTTSLTNGAVIGIYQKAVIFYVVAKSSATNLNAPSASIPSTLTAALGGSITIQVTGSGLGSQGGATTNPTATWYMNGTPLNYNQQGKYGNFNGQSLTINNVSASDAGVYYAIIAGPGGSTVTNTCTLTAVQASLPVITSQPQPVTVAQGGTAVFTVAATGVGLNYQWKINGSPINSSVNGPRLVVFNAGNPGGGPAGPYSCTVSNAAGAVGSQAAALTIASSTQNANPGRLINLSVGTIVPSGGNVTLGMTVGGNATSGQQPLLIRGDGPTLGTAPFNLSGVMADPTLSVVNAGAGTTVASDDNWGGSQAIINADNATGAFPFASASSLDAAVVTQLSGGGYSAIVKNNVAAAGFAIAEVFDATANYTPVAPRLINLSTLFTVPAGGSITAGFTVGGNTSKTVLIRADGPALGAAPFNLPGVMTDPQLVLNSTANGAQLAVNAGWGGDSQLQSVMNNVGAFALKSGSLDSAIVVTLSPGGYSATASSASGGGGQVIIEVYEVP